jgi:hypothetical protein
VSKRQYLGQPSPFWLMTSDETTTIRCRKKFCIFQN